MCQAIETKKIIRILASVLLLTVISGGIGAGITVSLKRRAKIEGKKTKKEVQKLEIKKSLTQKTYNDVQGSNLNTGNKVKLAEKRITAKKTAKKMNKVRNILIPDIYLTYA